MKCLASALLLLTLSCRPCSAFQPSNLPSIKSHHPCSNLQAATFLSERWNRHIPRHHSLLKMSLGNDEDDDDDDDDGYIDDSELGDWRSFRATLVDGSADTDGGASPADNSGEDSTEKRRSKSVSKANEKLLKSQSEELAKEYADGVWAHQSSLAEVGGLVVRLPLEVEIYRSREKTSIGKDLMSLIEDDDNSSDSSSLLSADESKLAGKSPDLSFSVVGAQTLLWYKKAQQLIEEKIATIAALANEDGEINPRMLEPKAENLLKLYLDNQESWQEVCLIADMDEVSGTAQTFALNRPMAFNLSESLARLVLFGAFSSMNDSAVAVSEMNNLMKFVRAFEKSCAVYVGGPDKQDQKAVMIHGIADLEGATEIGKGTGLYKGGIKAATQGVLDGLYAPLDFRFFVGCHEYSDGDLDVAIFQEKYQPIACARPLALKQCIQLPKPLWHEVLELCGGELREISRLELMKRGDIQIDE